MRLRYGGTTEQMLHRLSEFYEFHELEYFMHEVKENGYTQSDAIRWLDLKTREDYVKSGGLELDIMNYLIDYLI